MIKFKEKYLGHTLLLPNKLTINEVNVHQFEKLMKEKFPDMIEEVKESEDKKGKKESAPAQPNA